MGKCNQSNPHWVTHGDDHFRNGTFYLPNGLRFEGQFQYGQGIYILNRNGIATYSAARLKVLR